MTEKQISREERKNLEQKDCEKERNEGNIKSDRKHGEKDQRKTDERINGKQGKKLRN